MNTTYQKHIKLRVDKTYYTDSYYLKLELLYKTLSIFAFKTIQILLGTYFCLDFSEIR